MKHIEHDPHEFKNQGNGIWWAGWALVALGWGWYLLRQTPDWTSLSLGGLTALIFVSWVMDMKYGKRLRDD